MSVLLFLNLESGWQLRRRLLSTEQQLWATCYGFCAGFVECAEEPCDGYEVVQTEQGFQCTVKAPSLLYKWVKPWAASWGGISRKLSRKLTLLSSTLNCDYWWENSCILYPRIYFFNHFFKDFIYLFLERGEGKEKERERNISVWLPLPCPLLGTWLSTQACALTGNRTGHSLVCRPTLNPLSDTSQGSFFNFSITVDIQYYISFRYMHQWLDITQLSKWPFS